jgi:hypothetical protein
MPPLSLLKEQQMTHKIKALGIAFIAIAAISSLAVSSAQAGTVHIEPNPAVVTGHIETGQQHKLQIPAVPNPFNSVCDVSTIEATVHQVVSQTTPKTQTVHDITATPSYSSCKLAGTNAQVTMNGCHYTLTGAGQPALTALVDVICTTPGKQIEIRTAICTVHIPAQNGLSHITFVNQAGNKITANATVGGITAVQTGAACPGGNNAHTNAASFTGNTLLNAFEDQGLIEKVQPHDGHQYTRYLHGAPATEFLAT